jgi:dephospho-CoA kinase
MSTYAPLAARASATRFCFATSLRADRVARDAWASYKLRLAALATNLEAYGRVKDPATDVLLLAAEAWADEIGWTVSHAHQ